MDLFYQRIQREIFHDDGYSLIVFVDNWIHNNRKLHHRLILWCRKQDKQGILSDDVIWKKMYLQQYHFFQSSKNLFNFTALTQKSSVDNTIFARTTLLHNDDFI